MATEGTQRNTQSWITVLLLFLHCVCSLRTAAVLSLVLIPNQTNRVIMAEKLYFRKRIDWICLVAKGEPDPIKITDIWSQSINLLITS